VAAAEKEQARINGIAQESFTELVKKAEALAARHRFDDARSVIDEQAAKIEIDDAAERAKAARASIESAARKYESDRESQAAAFADVSGRVLLAAGKDGVAAARVLLDREKSAIPAYDVDTDLLLEDLSKLEKVRVDPDVVGDTSAEGARTLLLVRLARGEIALAEQELEVIRSADGDVDLPKARIAAVRGVLARQAGDLLARAEAELAANHPDLALRAANEAQKLLPDFAPTTVMLARVRLAQNEIDLAIALLTGTVGRSDVPPEAHLRLGQALAKKGDDLARAESEIRAFLDDAPADDRLRPEAQTAFDDTHARRVESSVKRWRDQAKSAKSRGKRDVAEGLWGRIVDVLPGDSEALLRLAEIYIETQRKREAYVLLARIGKLEKATDTQKKRAAELIAPLQGLGYTSDDLRKVAADAEGYFSRDDWANAIRSFQAALNVSPYIESARAHLIRAFIAEAKGTETPDYASAAVEQADILAKLFPDDGLPFALRAEAELVLKDRASALKDATRAVINDPKCAAAQMALGHVHVVGGDAATALAAFRAAHQAEPSAEALLGTARAYLRLGDPASALLVLNTLKETYRVPRPLKDEYNELLQEALGGK
jgi:tetratricopeptide (TPR) repeat protein